MPEQCNAELRLNAVHTVRCQLEQGHDGRHKHTIGNPERVATCQCFSWKGEPEGEVSRG